MFIFSDKVVVVTGAAQGLGAAMAQRFLHEGAEAVALLDANLETLSVTAAHLDPGGKRTLSLHCNVANHSSVKKAFTQIDSHFGRVDVLINNAGITRDALAGKMTAEQFDLVVDVSLNGAFYCARQVIAGMRARGWGRIISLSSMSSQGNVGQANYAAAKAGVVGLTKTLSDELAAKNITVNCIAPGLINTDIITTIPPKQMEALLHKIPMGRIGEPEEVAALAAFLASDEAAYITGQCIMINGGSR